MKGRNHHVESLVADGRALAGGGIPVRSSVSRTSSQCVDDFTGLSAVSRTYRSVDDALHHDALIPFTIMLTSNCVQSDIT
jgi:hypothetical protein